jgi:hypothetical protein
MSSRVVGTCVGSDARLFGMMRGETSLVIRRLLALTKTYERIERE